MEEILEGHPHMLSVKQSGKVSLKDFWLLNCEFVFNVSYLVEVYSYYPEVILLMNYSSDIRDTVNYKEVMKQYGLGPNGGIVTSLNLFSTRFDQVLTFIEKKGSQCQ